MTRLLVLVLLLLLTTTAAGAETYWLEAKSTESIGRRFYLLRFPTVTLDPGEVESFWLSLASCPGGVDHVFALYVMPTGPGAWDVRGPGWGYPTAYGPYRPATSMALVNGSDAPMTFKIKLSARCDE